MKVEIIKGTINNGKEVLKPGTVLDVDDKEAENLIALGIVRKAGNGNTEKAAEKQAAEKRKALEEKALELKVGTAEEIKALSDEELKARIAKAGGESVKGFFEKLFGGNK